MLGLRCSPFFVHRGVEFSHCFTMADRMRHRDLGARKAIYCRSLVGSSSAALLKHHRLAEGDPAVEINSGSTDLLLGGYHTGNVDTLSNFQWFVQGLWQHEIATEHEYRPGSEANAPLSASFAGWKLGSSIAVAPVAQVAAPL